MKIKRLPLPALALGSALLLAAATPAANAAAVTPLKAAVDRGAQLFAHATFGGRGATCATCHLDMGKGPGRLPNGHVLPSLRNAAAIFPRYSRRLKRVVTLDDQVRHCIRGGLAGHPPAYGSRDLVALVAYLGSIAHGQPVAIGGKPK